MDSWNDASKFNHVTEPPPELPLHSFTTLNQPTKHIHGKRLVNKLKGWFANNISNQSINNISDYGRNDVTDYETDNYNFRVERARNIGEGKRNSIILGDEDPIGSLHVGNRHLVEDSTKTFMTGNNTDANNIPQFPVNKASAIYPSISFQVSNGDIGKSNALNNKPISLMLKDPSILPNFSTSLHSKHVTLHTITRRINSIANKKQETSRIIQKFLRDLMIWGQNSSSANLDSMELVNEIQDLFQQDLLLEQKISEKLKYLTNELGFISMREDELSTEKKNLLAALKKYGYVKDKKGEYHEETNFFKERVIAHEKAFEIYKAHYQYAVSVTARQVFKEVGIEYYERATDLKESSGEFLKKALQTLETTNGEGFVKDLEKIRMIRAERNWSKLKPEQKVDPQSWVDLVSGKHDCDDTLMKKVYEGLPVAYTPTPRALPLNSPRLNFQTAPEESISGISSDRFNKITSNEFFSEKSPTKQLETEYSSNKTKLHEANDENESMLRSLNPSLFRMDDSDKRILSLRKPSNNNEFVKKSDSTDKKPLKASRVERIPEEDEHINGFILNFGDISQQFDDAERHLQENRWNDSAL